MDDKSLEQRQLVWHHFKNGALGITTDGPYVLDKRDVWYMRNVNEQDAGYKLESDYATISRMTNEGNRHLYDGTQNQFVPCDMCYQCLCIHSLDYITDCPVCSSKVCGDCSCGCEEPSDWVKTDSGSRMKVTASPATESAWRHVNSGRGTSAMMHHNYDALPSIEELNIIRQAFIDAEQQLKAENKLPQPTDRPMTFDPFGIQGRSPTEWINPPIGKTPGPGRFMHVDYGTNERSALGIKCLRCNYFQVIPLPLPKRVNYYRCANCGNGIEIEDLF